MEASPSIGKIVNELRNQNANLPTEKKQNIIVVQDNASNSQADKTGQMLTVLNNIFNAVSEQLRLTRESLNLQKEDRLAARDFQKEAMDVSSGKYEPPQLSGGGEGGGGGASPVGGGGGIIEQVGKVGGGLWESAKGLGKAAVGVAARHPIATAVGAGAAIGLGTDYILGKEGVGGEIGKVISKGEGGYGSFNRGRAGDAGGRKIDFSNMTIQEIMEKQSLGRGNPNRLFAVGKYQIIPSTMRAAVQNMGIDPRKEKFTPEMQEKIFREYLIDEKQGGSIKRYVTGKSDNMFGAQRALAREFASVADPATGRSRYGGVGGNRASTSASQVAAALQTERRQYQENIKKGMSPEEAWSALSGAKISKKSSPETGTATKLTKDNEQPHQLTQPTASKMVDTSDLRVKGGLKGQAFKGGETEQGILNLARTIQADEANLPGGLNRFSSFNDAYHLKANPKSKHTQGLAMDFSLKNAKYSSEAADYIKQKLLASGMTEEEFKIINEYKNPSKHATGGHIHVNFANKKAAEKFAKYSSGEGQQTKLASNEEQLPKTGRHQLERTDEKSSVLQASMFAPLEKAIDKMSNILTSIDKNTGKTEEHTKEIKTASKEEQTKTEEPTATKTETEETEIPTATKAEEEQDQSQDLASIMGGSDEGSNVMKMLFGQGGFMGSAEPIEPGSAKRKYIDSLPSYTDNLGEMVKNLILGEGDVDIEQALGALGGTATAQGTNDQLGNLGVTPTMPQNLTEQLLGEVGAPQKQKRSQEGKLSPELRKEMEEKYKDLSPADRELAIQEFENALNKSTEPGVDRVTSESPGLFKFDVSKPEADLSKLKSDQLSSLGVNPFGGQQNGMLNNIFSGEMPSVGNNPFYSMQGMLGKIGSVASMGQNIGGMMKQGGLGGAQGVMNQVGGILRGMGSGFPMAQGIGGMLGNIGNIMGSVQGMQNIGQGGMGGVMGGIGAASGVLGSLGNIFGNVQGMGGGLGKMMGGLGVTPFGGGEILGGLGNMVGMAGGIGNIASRFGGGGINQGINTASGIMSSAGGLFNTATSLGSSVGRMFGGIGDSLGGLFGGGGSGGSKGISSLGIGDDAASLKQTYSESSEPVGGNLESLQSSNEELSASPASLSTDNGSTPPPGAGGGMAADRGTITSSQGASAEPKSIGGSKTGSSSGAMGIGMEGYNDCPTLYKWQFRTSYWGKV